MWSLNSFVLFAAICCVILMCTLALFVIVGTARIVCLLATPYIHTYVHMRYAIRAMDGTNRTTSFWFNCAWFQDDANLNNTFWRGYIFRQYKYFFFYIAFSAIFFTTVMDWWVLYPLLNDMELEWMERWMGNGYVSHFALLFLLLGSVHLFVLSLLLCLFFLSYEIACTDYVLYILYI